MMNCAPRRASGSEVQLVLGNRCSGKSTVLRNTFFEERAEGKNVFFVAPDGRGADMLRHHLGAAKRAVFSLSEVRAGVLLGRKVDGLYVDDADLMLRQALGGYQLAVVSMNVDESAFWLPTVGGTTDIKTKE